MTERARRSSGALEGVKSNEKMNVSATLAPTRSKAGQALNGTISVLSIAHEALTARLPP
jgi:hypothetical protein